MNDTVMRSGNGAFPATGCHVWQQVPRNDDNKMSYNSITNNIKRFVWAFTLLTGLLPGLGATPSDATPDFQEIYGLLRDNLTGTNAADLNQAAVNGLLDQLYPKVTLLPPAQTATEETNAPSVIKTEVMDNAYGYFRFDEVAPGAAKELRQAYDKLNAKKSLAGLIIDLRFADGTSYESTAAVADLFFATERPLINWGEGMKKSAANKDAWRLPVTVLVNAKTAGAAEALAGILREGGIALVLGSPTAGQASEFKEFKLKDGQRLRIATAPIKLGNGKDLPATGLKPDIEVPVSLEDEETYLENAYQVIPRPGTLATTENAVANPDAETGTNTTTRRLNEAELVRRHREGLDIDSERPTLSPVEPADEEPEPPVLQDPVLARALDLLKGLAVIHVKPAR